MDEISTAKRRALYVAVAALCTEIDFGGAEKAALESLVEILQSCRKETRPSTFSSSSARYHRNRTKLSPVYRTFSAFSGKLQRRSHGSNANGYSTVWSVRIYLCLSNCIAVTNIVCTACMRVNYFRSRFEFS